MDYSQGIVRRRRVIPPSQSFFSNTGGGGVAAATQWNPSDQVKMTVSGSGRTATYNGSGNANCGIRSIAATTASQKVYIEHLVGLISHAYQVGFADISAVLAGGTAAGDSPSHAFTVSNGAGQFFCVDSVDNTEGGIASFTTGDRIGIAFNTATGLVWFRKNGGAWNTGQAGGQDPAAGTGGIVVPFAGPYYAFYAPDGDSAGGPDATTTNFASTDWVDTVPVGYSQLAA